MKAPSACPDCIVPVSNRREFLQRAAVASAALVAPRLTGAPTPQSASETLAAQF